MSLNDPALPTYVDGTATPAICVDLDGTLIHSDMLAECFLAAIRKNPFVLFSIPFWLLKGRSVLKARLSAYFDFDPSLLPYNFALIEYLQAKKRAGHRLYLATAANVTIANAVAQHVGLFDAVLASDELTNLKGERKLKAIEQFLGPQPFWYAANAREDLAIWKKASSAIAVNTSTAVKRTLEAEQIPVAATFTPHRFSLRLVLRALRVYQWTKNVLIFAPLFLSHQVSDMDKVVHAALAFAAFSFCASAFYLLNDLLDLPADRAHPRKRNRPFAAGQLSIPLGIVLVGTMFAAVIVLACFLPLAADLFLALYAVINFGYSTYLKQVLFLDVLVLSFLYTLRILFGAAAEEIMVSVWTLAFSIFLFLGLALVKRLTEMVTAATHPGAKFSRRAYLPEDISPIRSFASSALYLSVLVLAFYINSPDVVKLYHRPPALWMVCLLLIYWVSRVLMLANRGLMTDDPIIFAFKDRVSRVVAVLALICVAFAV